MDGVVDMDWGGAWEIWVSVTDMDGGGGNMPYALKLRGSDRFRNSGGYYTLYQMWPGAETP